MKRCVLALIVSLVVSACSVSVTTSPTFGVDGAPGAIKATFLVVSNQAARLAGHEVSDEEWIEFARAVCRADLEDGGLAGFVADWAGASADATISQMWSTAGNAAVTSFCSSDS